VTSTPIAPGDPAYPAALLALAEPGRSPPVLYVRGRLPGGTGVAVVGTRRPSQASCAFTRTLVSALVTQGIAIWSGGAAGVDAAAHEAALDAGGTTVLVAGGGLDRPYPPEHKGLFARVLERGGALVARVPDGTPPMAPHFLQRNAVLAAMTAATVVIEAGLASGARSTAAAARRLGRPLCVVPHPPWEERGQGCALELVKGASPIYSAAEVLAALGRPPPAPVVRPRKRRRRGERRPAAPRDEQPPLPLALLPDPEDAPGAPADALGPSEAAILAVLDGVPRHFDEACERAGLGAPEAAGAVLTLTLRAVVVEGPAGFFRRFSPSRW
jgi:DNA processing protein